MRLFKCKHPIESIGVAKEATFTKRDKDFVVITYHLVCRRCGEDIELNYAKMIGGVDEFLRRDGA